MVPLMPWTGLSPGVEQSASDMTQGSRDSSPQLAHHSQPLKSAFREAQTTHASQPRAGGISIQFLRERWASNPGQVTRLREAKVSASAETCPLLDLSRT